MGNVQGPIPNGAIYLCQCGCMDPTVNDPKNYATFDWMITRQDPPCTDKPYPEEWDQKLEIDSNLKPFYDCLDHRYLAWSGRTEAVLNRLVDELNHSRTKTVDNMRCFVTAWFDADKPTEATLSRVASMFSDLNHIRFYANLLRHGKTNVASFYASCQRVAVEKLTTVMDDLVDEGHAYFVRHYPDQAYEKRFLDTLIHMELILHRSKAFSLRLCELVPLEMAGQQVSTICQAFVARLRHLDILPDGEAMLAALYHNSSNIKLLSTIDRAAVSGTSDYSDALQHALLLTTLNFIPDGYVAGFTLGQIEGKEDMSLQDNWIGTMAEFIKIFDVDFAMEVAKYLQPDQLGNFIKSIYLTRVLIIPVGKKITKSILTHRARSQRLIEFAWQYGYLPHDNDSTIYHLYCQLQQRDGFNGKELFNQLISQPLKLEKITLGDIWNELKSGQWWLSGMLSELMGATVFTDNIQYNTQLIDWSSTERLFLQTLNFGVNSHWQITNGSGIDGGGIVQEFFTRLGTELSTSYFEELDGYLVPKDLPDGFLFHIGCLMSKSIFIEQVALGLRLHPIVLMIMTRLIPRASNGKQSCIYDSFELYQWLYGLEWLQLMAPETIYRIMYPEEFAEQMAADMLDDTWAEAGDAWYLRFIAEVTNRYQPYIIRALKIRNGFNQRKHVVNPRQNPRVELEPPQQSMRMFSPRILFRLIQGQDADTKTLDNLLAVMDRRPSELDRMSAFLTPEELAESKLAETLMAQLRPVHLLPAPEGIYEEKEAPVEILSEMERYRKAFLKAVSELKPEIRQELWLYWFGTYYPDFRQTKPTIHIVPAQEWAAGHHCLRAHSCSYLLELPELLGTESDTVLEKKIADTIHNSLANQRLAGNHLYQMA